MRGEVNLFRYGDVSPADRQTLKRYIGDLVDTPITECRSAEQFSYWVNIYNALTVDLVLDLYPVKSIRDIALSSGLLSYGPWDKKLVRRPNIVGRIRSRVGSGFSSANLSSMSNKKLCSQPDRASIFVNGTPLLRVIPEVRRVFEENFRVYGVRKVWRQLKREAHDVDRCTVARLKRSLDLQVVVRGKPVGTTISVRRRLRSTRLILRSRSSSQSASGGRVKGTRKLVKSVNQSASDESSRRKVAVVAAEMMPGAMALGQSAAIRPGHSPAPADRPDDERHGDQVE